MLEKHPGSYVGTVRRVGGKHMGPPHMEKESLPKWYSSSVVIPEATHVSATFNIIMMWRVEGNWSTIKGTM
jgi:hypothetical protein